MFPYPAHCVWVWVWACMRACVRVHSAVQATVPGPQFVGGGDVDDWSSSSSSSSSVPY